MPALPPASRSLLEWPVLIHSSRQQAFLKQLLILMLDVRVRVRVRARVRAKKRTVCVLKKLTASLSNSMPRERMIL